MRLKATILLSFILLGCSGSSEYDLPDLSFLMPGETFIDIRIDNEDFYSEKNQFIGKVSLFKGAIRTSLSDIQMSNLQLELTKPDILTKLKEPFNISTNPTGKYTDYGSLLIGKKTEKGLKGYILSRATFQWLEWTKELAVLKCNGFLVSPGSAYIPENEVPFEGHIYFKSPTIISNEIDKSEVF